MDTNAQHWNELENLGCYISELHSRYQAATAVDVIRKVKGEIEQCEMRWERLLKRVGQHLAEAA